MTQAKSQFVGVYTALCTPMRAAADQPVVDEAALAALCEAQLRGGVDGLVACGTTGEAATLTPAEQARVIRVVVEAVQGRVPVLAGVGSPSTAHSVELAKAAIAQGVDGLLAVTPYYNRPSQEGLVQHFSMLARLGHPIMLYNVPARTGCDLLPDTVARLGALPQIVAIKEASGSVVRAQQLWRLLGDRMAILSGEDALNYPLYCVGARGCVSVVSNVAPALTTAVWDAFAAGDHAAAQKAHDRFVPLADLLFSEPNPIPAKAALHLLGQLDNVLRLPLVPMTDAGQAKLRALLAVLELLP
jgi:4-hydroxy-tetrahydrodipicolinate synthase